LRDQSTAHGFRVGAASRSTNPWLDAAIGLAPAGYEEGRDGLCIHRAGTVLYVDSAVPHLLGLDPSVSAVGSRLLDWFGPAGRARVAWVLSEAGEDPDGVACDTWVDVSGVTGRASRVVITARSAGSEVPVDLLYVQPAPAGASAGTEDGAFMTIGGEKGTRSLDMATVLICDDESRLGALTAGLLADYGFHPVTVDTGEAALATVRAAAPRVDLLLLDVNLSQGSSAKQVLAVLGELEAPPRVLLTSGLAEEDVEAELVSHPLVAGYVPKPYAVEQLVQSIRRTLRGPGSAPGA
jgi:CheY-like chemotaxis protein